jgi:lysophospholipase L1-like esterase
MTNWFDHGRNSTAGFWGRCSLFSIFTAVLLCVSSTFNSVAAQQTESRIQNRIFKFDFGGRSKIDFIRVTDELRYTGDVGYGVDYNSKVTVHRSKNSNALLDGYLTSDKPYFFSVRIPEGNYRVRITVGDDDGMSDVSIRAECRRMMVNREQTQDGEHKTVEFTVHVRDSLIHGSDDKVKLKNREHSYLHWDDKLTLEFNGPSPKINAIEIMPEQPDVITVFLAGNSTVVDGAAEPFSAWGQMIPSFFKPGKVAIANYAESGETLSGFIAARRFAKVLSLLKAGDFVFVEFGHNDQKQKGDAVGAFTSYKKDLEFFIGEVKSKGATPVIVTSLQRRRFDDDGRIVETLGDYPAAGREVARQQGVPLIDLNAMSKVMYEAWGPQESINAFVYFFLNIFFG